MRSVTGALYRPERLLLQLTTKSRQRPMRRRHTSPPQRRKRKLQEIREITLSFLPTPTAPLFRHWLSRARSWPRDKLSSNWLTPAPPRSCSLPSGEASTSSRLGSTCSPVWRNCERSCPAETTVGFCGPRDPHLRSQTCSWFPRGKHSPWS